MFGLPLELITMLFSTVLGGVMSIWGQSIKAKEANNKINVNFQIDVCLFSQGSLAYQFHLQKLFIGLTFIYQRCNAFRFCHILNAVQGICLSIEAENSLFTDLTKSLILGIQPCLDFYHLYASFIVLQYLWSAFGELLCQI